MKYEQLQDVIKKSNKILIVSHINPDGDALGSMLSLYTTISENFKKKSDMLVVGHMPACYRFLPNADKLLFSIDTSIVYDLVITADVAALERLSNYKILFDKAKNRINIDHHKTNIRYGDLNFVEDNASSTGEVLLDIYNKIGLNISLESAICLYTAILTDTGGFRYENTTEKVFLAAAQLVKTGINPNKIYKHCYELKSKNFVMFQNYCINKAKFEKDNKIAYTEVYKRDLEKFKAEDDFTEGLVESLRAIDTTDIAFVAKEIDSKTTKISMRSKKTDISKICALYGGGGHTYAAGCTIKADINNAIRRILKSITEYIDE